MIEVDLLDADGVIISVGAVDETFWNTYGAAATGYAAQRGLGIFVPGGAPQTGTAERNVYQWGDLQNWVASTSIGRAAPTAVAPAGWSTGEIAAAVAAGVAVGGLLAWLLLPPRR
jgi:hypothetical protein